MKYKKNWIVYLSFVVITIGIVFIIINFISKFKIDGIAGWKDIDKLTYHSNFLAFLYLFFWLFFCYKNPTFFLASNVYLLVTFFGYNLVLWPSNNEEYGYFSLPPYHAIQSFWLHIINPLLFFALSFFLIWKKQLQLPLFFWKSLLKVMLYPTIYLIYIISVPYYVTDQQETYSVYGAITNTKDYPISYLYIGAIYFILFPASNLGFYFLFLKLQNYGTKRQK